MLTLFPSLSRLSRCLVYTSCSQYELLLIVCLQDRGRVTKEQTALQLKKNLQEAEVILNQLLKESYLPSLTGKHM